MTIEIISLRSQIVQTGGETSPQADPWAECALRWLEAVERRRGSARSRREYEKSLKAFWAFLPPGTRPESVTGSDCQRWARSMSEAGLAKSTINARLAAVSSFYSFACAKFEVRPGHYLHGFNPATLVQREHVNPYEKSQGLSIEGAKALLAAFDQTTIKGLRDRAICTFYLYTGRRRIEVARLVWADLRPGDELGEYEYRYLGKGGKGGWRELPGPAWQGLETYLKAAGRLVGMQPTSPLFEGRAKGQSVSERQINYIIDGAAARAGLGHVKVHGLRHTAAKLKRKAGDGIEEVSQFLDHSSIATTQIYLGAVEARKDRSWRKVEGLLG